VGAGDDLEAWDRVATNYAQVIGQLSDSIFQRFEPFLWRNLGGDLAGLRLLDVGCGHGCLAEICRLRGASVVGVDGSSELLAIARERYPEVVFERADLTAGLPESVATQTFDRVVAHMVVMDIPTLEPLAASLSRCVAVDGVVVVTLPHPSFFMQSPAQDPSTGEWSRRVRGYLNHEEWWVETFGGHRHYHRPLDFYISWLASAGLGVIGACEPPVPLSKPSDAWDERGRWFVTIPTLIGLAAVPVRR
jgi:SAM-dependent methyltransferase